MKKAKRLCYRPSLQILSDFVVLSSSGTLLASPCFQKLARYVSFNHSITTTRNPSNSHKRHNCMIFRCSSHSYSISHALQKRVTKYARSKREGYCFSTCSPTHHPIITAFFYIDALLQYTAYYRIYVESVTRKYEQRIRLGEQARASLDFLRGYYSSITSTSNK
jgi:hypothetical protein